MDVIHVAGQEELDKCLKIRMEVFVDEQGVPAEEEVDEFDELGGSCRHFLIMLDGEEAAAARWRLTAKARRRCKESPCGNGTEAWNRRQAAACSRGRRPAMRKAGIRP